MVCFLCILLKWKSVWIRLLCSVVLFLVMRLLSLFVRMFVLLVKGMMRLGLLLKIIR